MKIENKLESIKKINQLNLNRFQESLFRKNEDKKILDFIDKYHYKFYAVRSKNKVGDKNNSFKTSKDKVLEVSRNFDLFTINVSSFNFGDHLVLIGDVLISKTNEVWLIASKNKNYTGKMAEQNPDYNLKTDIFDKKLNKVPGFDLIYQYIVENNLIDVIVELAVYDKPLGINNHKVIVFEIRTDY